MNPKLELAMRVYTFHTDGGHGWLAVPFSDLQTLNIADKITSYSFHNGAMAYLEEDCDLSTFCNAWEGFTGLAFDFQKHTKESYTDYPSPVRQYWPYAVSA